MHHEPAPRTFHPSALGTLGSWPVQCSRPFRSASSGRRSTRSCSACITSTTIPPATTGWARRRTLAGREIGNDFAGIDGWRMYHGTTVPGLPAAPAPRLRDRHVRPAAGSSITPTRSARPPASAAATCSGSPPGEGIVHSEMFPLLDATARTRSSSSRSGSTCRPPTRWSSRTSRCCGTRTFRITWSRRRRAHAPTSP